MIYSVWEKTQSPEYGGFAFDPAWVYAAGQSNLADGASSIASAPWAGTKTGIALGIAAIPDPAVMAAGAYFGGPAGASAAMVTQYAVIGGLIAWDYIDG